MSELEGGDQGRTPFRKIKLEARFARKQASRSVVTSSSPSPLLSISEKCQVTDQTNRARWLPALLRLLPIRLIVSLQQLSV